MLGPDDVHGEGENFTDQPLHVVGVRWACRHYQALDHAITSARVMVAKSRSPQRGRMCRRKFRSSFSALAFVPSGMLSEYVRPGGEAPRGPSRAVQNGYCRRRLAAVVCLRGREHHGGETRDMRRWSPAQAPATGRADRKPKLSPRQGSPLAKGRGKTGLHLDPLGRSSWRAGGGSVRGLPITSSH